jgi:hypothetical protein
LLEGTDLPPYPAIDKEPIPITTLAPRLRGNKESMCMFAGFPASKTGRKGTASTLFLQPYNYSNILAPLSVYPSVGADPATHIVLTFDRKRSMGPLGRIETFPDPHGMSGSPIWLLSDDLELVPVIGIATRWVSSQRVVIGTDIAVSISMIERLNTAP